MPFQSEKQRRYLWANEPEIAREWTDRYGARGGGIMRVPFQEGGLESLPFRDYFKLPPFSEGNPYTNTWTFPTGEEELTTESSVGQGGLPASYIYNTGGGEGGEGNLNLTYTPGAVAKSTPAISDLSSQNLSVYLGNPALQAKYSNFNEYDKFVQSQTPNQPDKENWFSNLFKSTPKVRGTLGDRSLAQYQMGQKLPSWIAAIAGIQSPFNPKSKNYNKNFVDQLNYLESSGAPGSYIGIDPQSGLRKYGPDSVLSGQNVWSGFGSNDYEEQLQKQIAKYQRRWDSWTAKKRAEKQAWKEKYLNKAKLEQENFYAGMGPDHQIKSDATKQIKDKMTNIGDATRAQKKQARADYARVERAYQEDTGPGPGSYAPGGGSGAHAVDASGSTYTDPFDPGGGEKDGGFIDGSNRRPFFYGGRAPRGNYFNGGIASLWRR